MAAELYFPIIANQGCDWAKTFAWSTSSSQTSGTSPVDLTNAFAVMAIRASLPTGPTVPILQYVSANAPGLNLNGTPAITLGGTAGTVAIDLTTLPIQNLILSGGLVFGTQYIYDLYIVLGSGAVWKFLEGTFSVSPSVTH